jgi:di/tricarboxylate transporter
MSEFAISTVILAVLMIVTALLSILLRMPLSRRSGRSMPVILENALGFRIITLILGIPALYLLDHHVAYAAIDWAVLTVVGVGRHTRVRPTTGHGNWACNA